MPSVQYFNQTAPFWDFVASMEEQGTSHPLFGGNNNNNNNDNNGEASDNENDRANQWGGGWGGFPWGPFPHRGRGGPHPPPPPPPPAHHEGPPAPPAVPGGESEPEPEAGPSDEPHHQRGGRRGRRGHEHPHPHHGPWRGRHGMGGRGPYCRGNNNRNFFNPYAMGNAAFGGLADLFQSQLFPDGTTTGNRNGSDEFTPEIDVFDATEAFVVHVSLPGAKKEDIAVNWDAEKSELSISGVVHRPGDEELLKTISMNERKVGAFDRKVRLGSRANPAQVEVDGIVARMEDGVLRVEVPKLDAGYVEVKRVDIE